MSDRRMFTVAEMVDAIVRRDPDGLLIHKVTEVIRDARDESPYAIARSVLEYMDLMLDRRGLEPAAPTVSQERAPWLAVRVVPLELGVFGDAVTDMVDEVAEKLGVVGVLEVIVGRVLWDRLGVPGTWVNLMTACGPVKISLREAIAPTPFEEADDITKRRVELLAEDLEAGRGEWGDRCFTRDLGFGTKRGGDQLVVDEADPRANFDLVEPYDEVEVRLVGTSKPHVAGLFVFVRFGGSPVTTALKWPEIPDAAGVYSADAWRFRAHPGRGCSRVDVWLDPASASSRDLRGKPIMVMVTAKMSTKR